MSGIDQALRMLRHFPRVALNNLRDLPHSKPPKLKRRGRAAMTAIYGEGKGPLSQQNLPILGLDKHHSHTPFYLRTPMEPYNFTKKPEEDTADPDKRSKEAQNLRTEQFIDRVRREYKPFSLLQLQRLIDLGRVDPNRPIDLTTLCNTYTFRFEPSEMQFGVMLTEEGRDVFRARVHLEVQCVTHESVIAAVERNGGVLLTRYYDPLSLEAKRSPLQFLAHAGRPIPRCKLPPKELVARYSDAAQRGYLADPVEIAKARVELAAKYGYELPDLRADAHYDTLLSLRKDARQIFYGLQPGWLVNLSDRTILKPTSEDYSEFYTS